MQQIMSWQCNILTIWCNLHAFYPWFLNSDVYPMHFGHRLINPQICNSFVGTKANHNAKIKIIFIYKAIGLQWEFLHSSLQYNTHKSQFNEGTQVQVKLEVTITVL